MKIGKTLLIIFIVLAGFIPAMLTVVLISNALSYGIHTEPTAVVTQAPVFVSRSNQELLTDTEIVMEMDERLYALFEDRYNLDFSFAGERKVLTVSTWGDVPSAFTDEQWSQLVTATVEASQNWSDTFKANGHDILVYVNYVEPNNIDEIYISACNGVLVYDGPRGIDLMDQLFGQ